MTKNKKVYHSKGEKVRKKRIAILSILILLVCAAACFIVGFGISEGWEAVGAWFHSKWATLTVVCVLFVGVALLYAFFALQDRKDFR